MSNQTTDLKVSDLLDMSHELWKLNSNKWSPMKPEYGKDFILFMIEEIGEVISIIKKKKVDEIMSNSSTRDMFVEELVDVMMYFSDVLNRYQITAEEFSDIYMRKHKYNLKRNYEEQYSELFK